MKAPVFPVFSLKTYYNYVIAAGGGGSKDFGKKNGILILDETTYKDIAFYETEDIIVGLSISRGEMCLEIDDLRRDEEDSSISTSTKSLSGVLNDFPLFFAGRGTNFIYVCKFDGTSLTPINKIEKSANVLLFKRHLLFISNKKLFAIYDAIHKIREVKKTKKYNKQSSANTLVEDEIQEEYIYALKKVGNKILVEREEGKTDIPNTWDDFFIVGNRIHKVAIENQEYSFVFNGKKYSYQQEIGDIACLGDETLVFYLKGVDSQLIFLGKTQAFFKIPKITCMTIDSDEFVSIGTADGKGYLFKNFKLFCEKKLCDLSITGISYEKGYFYYSSFNGLVNRKKVFSLLKMLLIIFFILMMFIAIVIQMFRKKNELVEN